MVDVYTLRDLVLLEEASELNERLERGIASFTKRFGRKPVLYVTPDYQRVDVAACDAHIREAGRLA